MRINGFDQIKGLYSLVFSQRYDFTPQHISLYVFLINQNNRNNWVEWFKCPYDLGMNGACIGSKKTYYNCLSDLQEWGLLKYEKGENMWRAPKIKLEVLKCTSTDTATVPQSEPLPTPLPTHIYKPITSNLKPMEASPTHALAIFVKDNLPNVSKLKNQLTDEQCEKLVKEFNKTTIKKTLEAMENRSDLTKKYRSVYLTLNNWLSREPNIQTNGNFSPSTSGPQTLEGTKIKFTPKPQQA